MKRLLLLLALAMIPLAAQAQFTTASDGNDGVIVTGYSPNTVTTLAIPATINGLPVTGIGSSAFAAFTSLTSVTIPNSVTSIGMAAFENCVNLTSVSLGSGVTTLGDFAFDDCAFSNFVIPNNVTTLGQSVFSGCAAMTSVTIGSGVTSIGDQAFFGCSDLASVTIPSSVTTLGNQVFYGCSNMTSLTLGAGLTTMGGEAFFDCESLTSVTIPSSVTSIGTGPFSFCTSLLTITVNSLNAAYSSSADGVLFNKNKTTLIQFPAGKSGSYTIPTTVTAINDEAFYASFNLTSVTIPSSVTSLGVKVFYACTGLTSVTVPATVTSIGDYALASCTALSGITIPASVTTLGQMAFSNDTGLLNVTIPNSVTTIEQSAFQACTSLQSVTIGNGVTSIGQFAFYACSDLTSALFIGNAPTVGQSLFLQAASGFSVSYYKAATGFASPTWTDSAGDMYPATVLITPQTITFPAIGTLDYPSSPYTLTASASSGLAVTFQLVSGPASVSNGVLTLTGTGNVVVQASQGGNSTYAAATPVQQTIVVEAGVDLSTWQSNYNITNLAATPFGDGVPNLLKYLYHINPTTTMTAADRTALPKVGTDTTTTANTTYLTLTYREYAAASGVTVNVQSSGDLQTWTTVTPDFTNQTGTDPNTGDPIVTVEVKVTAAKQFIRLRVTAP